MTRAIAWGIIIGLIVAFFAVNLITLKITYNTYQHLKLEEKRADLRALERLHLPTIELPPEEEEPEYDWLHWRAK